MYHHLFVISYLIFYLLLRVSYFAFIVAYYFHLVFVVYYFSFITDYLSCTVLSIIDVSFFTRLRTSFHIQERIAL